MRDGYGSVDAIKLSRHTVQVPDDARQSESSFSMPFTGDAGIEDEKLWFKRALIVSVFAFAITVVSAVVGIVVGIINNSSAFLAFGCDGFVDIFAGVFIIWRFSGHMETEQQMLQIDQRETRASVAIAYALLIIGIATAVQAIIHLLNQDPPNNDTLLFTVSGVLGGLLLIVALLKFYIAHKLKSLSLKESGVTNISGFFFVNGCLDCKWHLYGGSLVVFGCNVCDCRQCDSCWIWSIHIDSYKDPFLVEKDILVSTGGDNSA